MTPSYGQLHEQTVHSQRSQADRWQGAEAVILRGGGQEEIDRTARDSAALVLWCHSCTSRAKLD